MQVAGSLLGYKHTKESLVLIGEAHKGKIVSVETKILISEGRNGKTHSPNTLEKMSEAKSGENNPMFGKTGENHPRSKKPGTAGARGALAVFVYSNTTPTICSYEFGSYL